MVSHVYLALFQPEAEGGFSVTFPDVPGAITEGDDFSEAMRNAKDALESMLEALGENGDPLPQPRAPEQLLGAAQGAIVVAITADL